MNPPTSREDPVGEAYDASNWVLKTNERSVVKKMPLLGDIPSYSEWGGEARRWAKTLYNRPVSSVIDYLMVNLLASANRVDSESAGRLKYKLRAKIEQNEEAIKNGSEFEPIAAEWMFATLKSKHYAPSGQPIARITNQLIELGKVIRKELGIGIRTPEGVWDWIGRKRGELGRLGSDLTNR